ncbi:MAG: tetratricopeptide repeat protein [Planctomycetes bacterium]|nr:tetratricopeptide repeat protein [Planctomycetota bacterium]
MSRRSVEWLVLFTLALAAGCSTHAQRVRVAREQFYAGNLAQAAELFQEQIERHPADADANALDLAVIQLLDGRPADAEQTLRVVRDNFDHLEQSDAVEYGISMVTDDQRLAYAGANHEKILTRVMLALANLMDDGGDAEAYSLQVNAKQQELLQRATGEQAGDVQLAFAPLAIGPYIHGMIREATFNNYDDATRAYHQVVSWQPGFQAGKADFERARTGTHSRPGHGVVYLFALVNRGPVKEEVAELPTTVALLVADRILSALGEYELPPTIAPIKVPRVFVPPRSLDSVGLVVNGKFVGQTETICDVADLAARQEEVELPNIMARAVVRRVVKKAAVYAVKDHLEVQEPLVDLAMTAAGVVWEATEAADTRCWGLLPREIQVLRAELPAGSHDVALLPVTAGRPLSSGPQLRVDVHDGRNTYLLACFPNTQPIGQVLQRSH